jgi:hypothetical protein
MDPVYKDEQKGAEKVRGMASRWNDDARLRALLPFPGFFMYYPSRRHQPAALSRS